MGIAAERRALGGLCGAERLSCVGRPPVPQRLTRTVEREAAVSFA